MARRAAIAPTPATPPRYSFLLVAPEAAGVPNWADGTTWAPEQCGVSGRVAVDCVGTDEMTAGDNPATQSSDPFVVYASDACSPFGFGARDFAARARRQLTATRSFQVANELWTGSLHEAADPDLEGGFLADDTSADTLTSAEVDPITALACLDGALVTCLSGRLGMIHVTPQVLTHLVASQAIRLDGQAWRTPMGNLVVADAGYDGSAPDGTAASTTQFAYATDLIAWRLSPIEMIPGTLDNAQAWAQAMDREVNDVTVWAWQLAQYEWDRCCHFAAEIDITYCEPS